MEMTFKFIRHIYTVVLSQATRIALIVFQVESSSGRRREIRILKESWRRPARPFVAADAV